MKKILDVIEKATGIKPVPLEISEVKRAIVYNFFQSEFLRWRMEIRVIDFSFLTANETAEKIVNAVCDFGDKNRIEGISSVMLNGGGVLKDKATNTVQRLLYLDVVKER